MDRAGVPCRSPFASESTYALPLHGSDLRPRPPSRLLRAEWKVRGEAARDSEQPYGIAARQADSRLGMVGSGREGVGRAPRDQRETTGDRPGELERLPASRARRWAVPSRRDRQQQIVLDDVLIGDVWFASGQSNMEMPLKGFDGAPLKDSAEEIAHAGQPQIRSCSPAEGMDFPVQRHSASWTICYAGTASANFSAVGLFLRARHGEREHVPIGLIDSTWGGTVAEAWMSLEAHLGGRRLMPVFATRADDGDAGEMTAIRRAARKPGRPAGRHLRRRTLASDPVVASRRVVQRDGGAPGAYGSRA